MDDEEAIDITKSSEFYLGLLLAISSSSKFLNLIQFLKFVFGFLDDSLSLKQTSHLFNLFTLR
jgi:hypothetical protein